MLTGLRTFASRRATPAGIVAVSLLFTLALMVGAYKTPAVDLEPSFVGCRVLAAGQPGHLYSHSGTEFNHVYDPVWNAEAGAAAVHGRYTGPTYVQTPLWAALLEPACTTLSWTAFRLVFLALILLAACCLVVLVARFWTPSLFSPGWITFSLVALALTRPFHEMAAFVQPHIFFLLLTVVALMLARRGREVPAGILLACAAAVKITPGFLILYWLCGRRWKALGSFVASSAAIVALTVAVTSLGLFREFLTDLSATSNVLLIAYNNQSLAAWWEGMRMAPELRQWIMHPLPPGLKLVSTLLTLASPLVGAWFDRDQISRTDREQDSNPPYGAVFALLGVTVFPPISWNHYAIVLIIPFMLLIQRYLDDRRLLWLGLAVATYMLNLTAGIGFEKHLLVPIVRSHFFAMVLSMVAMAFCALRQRPVAHQRKLQPDDLLRQAA